MSGGNVELRVLGPVEVYAAGAAVDVGPARQRAVLAVLAVEVNRPVPPDRLAERVWGHRMPHRAASTLRTYISRLRARLPAGAVIERSGDGYLLRADESEVDLHVFGALLDSARERDAEERVELLGGALRLWRGEPFAGLDSGWFAETREHLAERHHTATLARYDTLLELGGHADVLGELRRTHEDRPLDERVAAQLMLALHRCGRRAEALAVFRRLRTRLIGELGVEPEPAVQELHGRMLAGTVPAAAQQDTTRPAPQVVPRQLPAVPSGFLGRRAALDALDGFAAAGPLRVLITGLGGIGKTTLAVAWAHTAAERYPDGQLYLDLLGFSSLPAPVSPEQALRALLNGLGICAANLPEGTAEQAGLYRTLLAGRRILIVLDNVRDSEQIAHLLPGTDTCGVLITSRVRLSTVVTRYAAGVVPVPPLDRAQARALLAVRVGEQRLCGADGAIDTLLTACGGVPLALAVVAARLTLQAELTPAVLARELRVPSAPMRVFDTGGTDTDLTAVLSWSERTLPPQAVRLLALLGGVPGPDIDVAAAAALSGLSAGEAERLLGELVAAHLVATADAVRHHLHDLVAGYARQRNEELLTPAEADAALLRLVEYYVTEAGAMARAAFPHQPRPGPRQQPATLYVPPPGAAEEAMSWFAAEYRNLLAAHQLAVDRDWHRCVWSLADALNTFQYRRAHVAEHIAVWQRGLAAAEALGDGELVLTAHRRLGHVSSRAARATDALHHLTTALRLAEERDDPLAQGQTHHNLALAHENLGDDRTALHHAERQLELAERAGAAALRARALNGIGWYSAKLGEYQRGSEFTIAAADYWAATNPAGEDAANALDTMAFIAWQTGDYQEAVRLYELVLGTRRRFGDGFQQAYSLEQLACARRSLGEVARARNDLRQAWALYETLGNTVAAARTAELLAELLPDGESAGALPPA